MEAPGYSPESAIMYIDWRGQRWVSDGTQWRKEEDIMGEVDRAVQTSQQQAGEVRILSRQSKLLPYKFTNEELLDIAKELGTALADIQSEEIRQQSVKRELAARLAELESNANLLGEKVRRREELREIETFTQINFPLDCVQEIRTDDFTVIKTREITDQDRQERLAI